MVAQVHQRQQFFHTVNGIATVAVSSLLAGGDVGYMSDTAKCAHRFAHAPVPQSARGLLRATFPVVCELGRVGERRHPCGPIFTAVLQIWLRGERLWTVPICSVN